MKQIQTIYLRNLVCPHHWCESFEDGAWRCHGRGCKERFQVQGGLLKVKVLRVKEGFLTSCPELCSHVYAGGDTFKEAIREIGSGVHGVLSSGGLPHDDNRTCFDFGRWREHFGHCIGA